MSLWTVLKLFSAVAVLAVMSFTGMMAYHILVNPLGGVFEQIIPNPGEVIGGGQDAEFAKMLDASDLPAIDPGEKTYQKARDLLAMGRLDDAREKLTTIIHVFPSSSTAPLARRIVGEMNLDEILATSHMDRKVIHEVTRGNSFLGIAAEHQTTLDMIMHLNSMMQLGNLQPGDELVVMPLDFRLLIEPKRKILSVWDEGRFICEYPIIHLGVTGELAAGKTTISSKLAELDGRRVPSHLKSYRAAEKVIQIAKPPLVIRGATGEGGEFPRGIILSPEDMEELSLITRVGNEVEIR